MAIVRVRQHVNPLAQKYQQPTQPPVWSDVFANPQLPLHLDIGCARGRFVLKMAELQPGWNFLGLEIREPLVIEANRIRDERGLTNLHYVFCNANLSLRSLLASLPPQTLQRVSIQFPDPWFKKRHQKRRVVQPELVSDLAEFLPTGAEVFLQSDVWEVAVEMGDRFQENLAFVRQGDWLAENPMPVPTEREIATQNKGEPVYRILFVKR
ncbi:MAG TPA: tRNA (guanosine(46)-N7)-methyltransferase TrmB [Synechococcales cyanobacterium M55_K2018_004]|nr:tRNA (guanosine(46)-N7)-methyltransferase TrmB [Synechococcales cyanobacterium M55_K2018_004]